MLLAFKYLFLFDFLVHKEFIVVLMLKLCRMTIDLHIVLSFQLRNSFDNLFEGLMESKDGEKEAAKVCI